MPSFRLMAIAALTLAAAAIHISRALVNPHITVLFSLNAAGYLALLALFVLVRQPGPRRAIRWTFVGYAALTFVLFFVWGVLKGEWPAIGFADKAIELALIALLLWPEPRTLGVAAA